MDETISNDLTLCFIIYAGLKQGLISMDEFIERVAPDTKLDAKEQEEKS